MAAIVCHDQADREAMTVHHKLGPLPDEEKLQDGPPAGKIDLGAGPRVMTNDIVGIEVSLELQHTDSLLALHIMERLIEEATVWIPQVSLFQIIHLRKKRIIGWVML